MSGNQIATRTEGALSRFDLTPEQVQEFTDKPLRAIPIAELRPLAWQFWAFWENLLGTQRPLAMRLREWVLNDGLTLDDARAAFERVNRPDRAAGYKFASDLLAALAGDVADVIKVRKGKEKEARQREQDAKDKAEAAPPDVIRAALAGIGRPDAQR
jgi:hypothetical protein